MIGFNHIFKQDYDKRVKVGDEYVFCYSKKKLSELYPEKDYSLVGAARRGSQKSREAFDVRQAKKLARLKKKGLTEDDVESLKLGDLHIGKSVISVFPKENTNALFDKVDGYVCVSDGTFVALHTSQVPFIASLLLILLAFISTVTVTTVLLLNPLSPYYIFQENPLPDIDPTVSPIEGDNSQKVQSNKGGGSIRVQFHGQINVLLGQEIAVLDYKNPNSSNQDVVLEVYVVKGDDEYFLGKSGLVPAGTKLDQISIKDREVNLTKGEYEGKVYFHSYDPATGQKAVVVANIGGIRVDVHD